MKASEGRLGRVFIIRLEDGDIIPGCIETFAEEKGIKAGFAVILGGAGEGRIVSGPRLPLTSPVEKIVVDVCGGPHEISGVGVLAPGEDGKPVLHLHASLGREGKTLTGCLRTGVKTWALGEVVLCEIVGVSPKRVLDAATGFGMLEP